MIQYYCFNGTTLIETAKSILRATVMYNDIMIVYIPCKFILYNVKKHKFVSL